MCSAYTAFENDFSYKNSRQIGLFVQDLIKYYSKKRNMDQNEIRQCAKKDTNEAFPILHDSNNLKEDIILGIVNGVKWHHINKNKPKVTRTVRQRGHWDMGDVSNQTKLEVSKYMRETRRIPIPPKVRISSNVFPEELLMLIISWVPICNTGSLLLVNEQWYQFFNYNWTRFLLARTCESLQKTQFSYDTEEWRYTFTMKVGSTDMFEGNLFRWACCCAKKSEVERHLRDHDTPFYSRYSEVSTISKQDFLKGSDTTAFLTLMNHVNKCNHSEKQVARLVTWIKRLVFYAEGPVVWVCIYHCDSKHRKQGYCGTATHWCIGPIDDHTYEISLTKCATDSLNDQFIQSVLKKC
jgi:hypothetical protein